MKFWDKRVEREKNCFYMSDGRLLCLTASSVTLNFNPDHRPTFPHLLATCASKKRICRLALLYPGNTGVADYKEWGKVIIGTPVI